MFHILPEVAAIWGRGGEKVKVDCHILKDKKGGHVTTLNTRILPFNRISQKHSILSSQANN